LDFENWNPFSSAHFWMLFIHRWIWRSITIKLFERKHIQKSSTYNEPLTPAGRHLMILFIFNMNRTPSSHLRGCSSRQTSCQLSGAGIPIVAFYDRGQNEIQKGFWRRLYDLNWFDYQEQLFQKSTFAHMNILIHIVTMLFFGPLTYIMNQDQSNVLDSGIRKHLSPQSPGFLHPTSQAAAHGKQAAG